MDNKPQNEIIIYEGVDGQSRIEVRMNGETVWLTQAQLAELFGVTPQNITIHLKSIFAEGELNEERTCKEYLQVQAEGNREVRRKVKIYDLDAVISLGYRISSDIATRFRAKKTYQISTFVDKVSDIIPSNANVSSGIFLEMAQTHFAQ